MGVLKREVYIMLNMYDVGLRGAFISSVCAITALICKEHTDFYRAVIALVISMLMIAMGE